MQRFRPGIVYVLSFFLAGGMHAQLTRALGESQAGVMLSPYLAPSHWLAGYAVVAVAGVVLMTRGYWRAALIAGNIGALLPLPLYLIHFGHEWPICLLGTVSCLLHAHHLMGFAEVSPEGQAAGWQQARRRTAASRLALYACMAPVATATLVNGHGRAADPVGRWVAIVLCLYAVSVTVAFEWHTMRPSLRGGPYLEYLLLAPVVATLVVPHWILYLPVAAAGRQLVSGARLWYRNLGGRELWSVLSRRPGHLLAYSFLFVIGVGTVLLGLPVSSSGAAPLRPLDALFTSVSATCVTGLIVVDTGSALSLFGQLVVLFLIQAGGLGIMTISTFIALILGRSIGLRGEFAIGEMIGEQRRRTAVRLIRFIVLVTLLIEFAGAVLLAMQFKQVGYDWVRAGYVAAFHSISAFCNAGFSLFPDSLVGFGYYPALTLTMAVLIILGGLGFGVLRSFYSVHRTGRRLDTHSYLVLSATVILLCGGTALIWLLEQNNTLADTPLPGKLLHTFFQAVTARTAGFNTMDMAELAPVTRMVMLVLMFIGAAPGSTGGGIKVTTLVVLFAVVRSVVLGREAVVVRGRRVSQAGVLSAVALLLLAAVSIVGVTAVLFLSQNAPLDALFFEAVSAFGTVGLSHGITPDLTAAGKLCIIVLMFVGRVGPLTLLLTMRPSRRASIGYPSANVMIG